MPTVVLGVTGCIGAYKACEVLRELQKRDVDVHVVMTAHATRFVSPMTFEALSRHPVFLDQFALGAEGDIRHISLADAAELLLVAPATANILGKFAHGIADDALSTLYLATRAPGAGGPGHERQHVRPPGGAREPATSCARGASASSSRAPGIWPAAGWAGAAWPSRRDRRGGHGRARRAGEAAPPSPRRRDLGARPCSSPPGRRSRTSIPCGSSRTAPPGGWAIALAEAARDRGARVILVSGPTVARAARGRRARRACARRRRWRARWRSRVGRGHDRGHGGRGLRLPPGRALLGQAQEDGGGQRARLVRTPDILASLGKAKGERFLVGFAAETDRRARERAPQAARPRTSTSSSPTTSRAPGAGFAVGPQRRRAHRRATAETERAAR